MELSDLTLHIEALIFASDKPLTTEEITELINNAFGFMEDKILPEQVAVVLDEIIQKYISESYPFSIRESGGGWQFLTKKDYHKTVAQLNGEKFLKRLSAAALETLAIIAYKQPITKGEIEMIRGVSSDYTVQKLLEKELIIISGRNEQLPGHPLIYSTSKTFMDYFGINSADDLPKIKEVLSEHVIEPTLVNHTELEQSDRLAVSDYGELIDAEAAAYEPKINGHSISEMETTNEEETPEAIEEPAATDETPTDEAPLPSDEATDVNNEDPQEDADQNGNSSTNDDATPPEGDEQE